MMAITMAAIMIISMMPVSAFAAEIDTGGMPGISVESSSPGDTGSGSPGDTDNNTPDDNQNNTPGDTGSGSPGDTESSSPSDTGSSEETGKAAEVAAAKNVENDADQKEKETEGLTVDVPLTDQDDPKTEKDETTNTVKGPEVGTTTVTGDQPTSPTDKTYDYTESTVVEQGSVTVKTEEIEVTATGDSSDMEKIVSETKPDGTNDIVKDTNGAAPEPDATVPQPSPVQDEPVDQTGDTAGEAAKLPSYEYIGTGNVSQFWAAYLYKTPDPSYPDEPPVYEKDGQAYYLRRAHNVNNIYKVEGLYVDGEQVVDEEEASFPAWYDVASQYVLIDGDTGEYITTYCADRETTAVRGFHYEMENLEEATYYDDAQAAMIRTVAQYGYWGTKGVATDADGNVIYKKDADGKIIYEVKKDADGNIVYEVETDADGNIITDENQNPVYKRDEKGELIPVLEPVPVPKTGSLDALKDMMRNAYQKDAEGNLILDENNQPIRIFTDDEIDNTLSDGVALTATQYAIWSFSNAMNDYEFINAHYVGAPGTTQITINPDWGAASLNSKVPESEQASVDLIFKLYHYLTHMEPTSYEEDKTTENTIINAANFLKDMAVTVVEKVEDHINNQDDDDDNDAYVANLTFALVVTPSTENGDDLTVKVLDASGKEIASGRIAGELKEGETMLNADADGNYTFSNITMVEGDQNFDITLEGVQNLKQGVYLYTSEVKVDEATSEETSSQTMVGMAEGKHTVDVTMSICFELSVDDEVVAKERFHRHKTSSGGDESKEEPPVKQEEVLPDPEDPQEEEEMVLGAEDIVEDVPEESVPQEPAKGSVPQEPVPQQVDDGPIPETGDSNHMTSAAGGMLAALAGMLLLRKRKKI